MIYKLKIISLVVCFILFSEVLFSQKDETLNFLSSIKKENLLKTDKYLSSPKFWGRLSGSKGFNLAAKFIAGELNKLKIKPFLDKNYFQNLRVEYNDIKSASLILKNKNGIKKKFDLGNDFVCRGFTGSGKFSAPIIFCGYGISQPEIGYDDYKDIDVKNKIVMCFKYNPAWSIENKGWNDGHPRPKSKVAFKKGAIGILFVSTPNQENPQKPIGSILHGSGDQNENFPQLHIDINTANEFLEGTDYSLSALQSIIDSTKKPFSLELKTLADLDIKANYVKEQPTRNVIGMIEGTDEKLKNEYLVIGSHLDHVGGQANKIYFPGANDNASGSSAVLELARTFINNKIKTKRTIIFAWFASEEQGLFGSRYFVENFPFPLEKITAMFNLDCVGHGDSIQIGNGKSSPKLWQLAKEQDSLFINLMIENTWSGGGADAGPFHEKGIPSIYFVTKNSYKHLHLMSDKTETLNGDLFEKITQLAFISALNAANGNYQREKVIP